MKTVKLKPFQKLLTIMISGNAVTRDEIDTLLGKEIYMYRISTYMWHIKTNANGVIRITKDGRKVTSYQLVNADEVKEYMRRTGILTSNFTPGDMIKKPSISKLDDLVSDIKKEMLEISDEIDAEIAEQKATA
mgnify:FL=1|jgi:hypothetical protein|tara:strand:+ start:231 stop:629 length:399 start_codon:yes stop_codon:yes gene_type:complete